MYLKKNLTRLLIVIGFVLFLDPSSFGQGGTGGLSLTEISNIRNLRVNETGVSDNVRSRSHPIFLTSSTVKDTLARGLNSSGKTREDYLGRSKNQKTAAWILLGAGTAMAVGGAIVLNNTDTSYLIEGRMFNDEDESTKAKIAELVMLTGIVADLVSIPLFISASHNKKLATTLSFFNQKVYYPHSNALCLNPSLTLKIRF